MFAEKHKFQFIIFVAALMSKLPNLPHSTQEEYFGSGRHHHRSLSKNKINLVLDSQGFAIFLLPATFRQNIGNHRHKIRRIRVQRLASQLQGYSDTWHIHLVT